jgi:hypothetical protein
MRHYIELTKPRITWLILMSTGVGYFFGLKGDFDNAASFARATGAFDWSLLLNTLIGTGLIASGTAALNQWYEREADRKMRRTAARPLPSGKMTARRALIFGIVVAAAGFADLAIGANLLAALLGLFTLGSYLFIYTPLKQRSHLSTVIGALPGAMPPLMGYAASHGSLTPEAWTLFAILFIWQFPHFLAIVDVPRRLRARGYQDAPGCRARWDVNRAPDHSLRLHVNSRQLVSGSARHVRQDLSDRRAAPRWMVPVHGRTRRLRSNERASTARAAGIHYLFAGDLWLDGI